MKKTITEEQLMRVLAEDITLWMVIRNDDRGLVLRSLIYDLNGGAAATVEVARARILMLDDAAQAEVQRFRAGDACVTIPSLSRAGVRIHRAHLVSNPSRLAALRAEFLLDGEDGWGGNA